MSLSFPIGVTIRCSYGDNVDRPLMRKVVAWDSPSNILTSLRRLLRSVGELAYSQMIFPTPWLSGVGSLNQRLVFTSLTRPDLLVMMYCLANLLGKPIA